MANFTCAGCGHSKTVGDELIGKRGRCPECGEITLVTASELASSRPASPLASAVSAPKLTPSEINYRAGARGFRLMFWTLMFQQAAFLVDSVAERCLNTTLPHTAYLLLGTFVVEIVAMVMLLGVTKQSLWRRTAWLMLGCQLMMVAFPILWVLLALANVFSACPQWVSVVLSVIPSVLGLYCLAKLLQLTRQSGELTRNRTLTVAAEKALRIFRIWVWLIIISATAMILFLLLGEMSALGLLFLMPVILANAVVGLLFVIRQFIVLWLAGAAYRKKWNKRSRR